MTPQHSHPDTAKVQDIRDLLSLFAGINPRAPEFGRTVEVPPAARHPHDPSHVPPTQMASEAVPARFNRFGQTATITREDIERARACVHSAGERSIHEMQNALRPFALLPIDANTPDGDELYKLGGVSIQAGYIRRARRLVGDVTKPAA